MYKTVWTPLALAFVAFLLTCGSLSIVNVVCSAVVRCLATMSCVLSHAPNNGCGERLKTMRLKVKYTLNNEVCLTGVYGIVKGSKMKTNGGKMYTQTCTNYVLY